MVGAPPHPNEFATPVVADSAPKPREDLRGLSPRLDPHMKGGKAATGVANE